MSDHVPGEPEPIPPPPTLATGFVETWRRVITDPRGFFADMPHTGGIQEPLIFLAVCAAVYALGTVVVGHGIGSAVSSFVSMVVGGFVSAAVLTLVAQHLFNGRAGFEPAFRVVAYAAAPLVLLWMPRLWILALLYSWYLQIRGVERVNDFEPTPAVLTVVVKTAILLLLAAALRGWRW